MSHTFAHPPHLASYTASKSSLNLVGAEDRDPHTVPVFDDKKSAPVLYLPPLLSSLPANFPSTAFPSNTPPVITETRLPNIDPASLSLHKALHYFRPSDDNYAATPYPEAFNWDELVLPEHEDREWYCVVFRSKRKPGSDAGPLYDADRLAHEEAVHNGGVRISCEFAPIRVRQNNKITQLLLYWYGIPNQATGMNLATCIWQSRKHAIAANSRPHHIQAMRLAAASYEVYDLERHVLRKAAGSTGVTIEAFTGGEVGW
ncbi:hypothetical protein R3P38DRAFT_3168709 [Favolaschia claudopus]|uniref:Uncharacterized protein n=1 Tax=Favolaschia claudopus TaxID=2862362 RepID=A0AAW0DYJ1_9AGAR